MEQEDFVGEDGLKRNLLKLRSEQEKIEKALKESALKRFEDKKSLHNFTNVLVEGARISPYYVGHVAAISIGLNVIAIGFIVFLAVF